VFFVNHSRWATIGLDAVLHDGVPVVENRDLGVVEKMPCLLLRAQLRLHAHECEVVAAGVKDETFELVDVYVGLRVVKATQLENIRDEEKGR